jgi:hypothetical protein
MKGSLHSEEQIIGILKEHRGGLSAPDIFPKHGINEATFYKREPTLVAGLRLGCAELRASVPLSDRHGRFQQGMPRAGC